MTVRAFAPPTEYTLGFPDLLEVRVFDIDKLYEEKAIEAEIASDGTIGLPLVGRLMAAGRSLVELRKAIEAAYAPYVVEPQASVIVKDFRSRKILVQGFVVHPGYVFLHQNEATLVDVVSLAGGLTGDAGTTALVNDPAPIVSGSPILTSLPPPREIDLLPLTEHGELTTDLVLRPGSVVVIPRAKEFYVSGYVVRAGAFPYQRPTTVLRAIALAGGLDARKASPAAVELDRRTSKGVERMSLDVDEIARGEAPDIVVLPGDSIKCGRTFAWAVYSEIVDTALGGFMSAVGFFLGTR